MELLSYFICDFYFIKYFERFSKSDFDLDCESIQDENNNKINSDDSEIIPPTTIYMIR